MLIRRLCILFCMSLSVMLVACSKPVVDDIKNYSKLNEELLSKKMPEISQMMSAPISTPEEASQRLTKVSDLLKDVQTKLKALNPKSPEMQQHLGKMDTSFTTMIGAIADMDQGMKAKDIAKINEANTRMGKAAQDIQTAENEIAKLMRDNGFEVKVMK